MALEHPRVPVGKKGVALGERGVEEAPEEEVVVSNATTAMAEPTSGPNGLGGMRASRGEVEEVAACTGPAGEAADPARRELADSGSNEDGVPGVADPARLDARVACSARGLGEEGAAGSGGKEGWTAASGGPHEAGAVSCGHGADSASGTTSMEELATAAALAIT
jgi:hypothetical protein